LTVHGNPSQLTDSQLSNFDRIDITKKWNTYQNRPSTKLLGYTPV
jgi:hypothetical protein